MIFTILLAVTGLTLSTVAIYYSVLGLTAIFAAAFWPIVTMGATLEISKLVAASWLKANWYRIPLLMKGYMMTAVVILMLITSMGVFGFLSKAHLDQAVPSGDVAAKIEIIDDKIKVEKDNILANKRALTQLDSQVDQMLSRTTDDRGANRAVQIRRQQAKERTALQKEITQAQTRITKLNEERAPIAGELRKIEAEVGPIKYIAAMMYGDNIDSSLLEKAVTWVITVIVFVFDPLAVLMLLASQMTWQWHRESKVVKEEPKQELAEPAIPDDKPANIDNEQKQESTPNQEYSTPEFDITKHVYLSTPWVWYKDSEPKEENLKPTETINIGEILNVDHPLTSHTLDTVTVDAEPVINKSPNDEFMDDAAKEALKWAEEQREFAEEESKKKMITWMEQDGNHQVKKSREM